LLGGRWSVLSLVVVAAVTLTGCEGAGTGCSCATAGALVAQPTLGSAIVGAAAAPPCTAIIQASADGGVNVFVEVAQTIGTPTGSCAIREVLADGTVLTAEFSFVANGGSGCCSGATKASGPAPAFTRADGGAS
jgi:hypothetical protein